MTVIDDTEKRQKSRFGGIFTEIIVAKPKVNIHSKSQSLFYLRSDFFVLIRFPGPSYSLLFWCILALPRFLTSRLHCIVGKQPEFLTAFVPSPYFFHRYTKSTATLTYHGNFALVVILSGRKFQNMPWKVKKFISSRVPKLLHFRAAVFLHEQQAKFANEVHHRTRFFKKGDSQLPSRIRQPLKMENGCKLS